MHFQVATLIESKNNFYVAKSRYGSLKVLGSPSLLCDIDRD